MIRNIVKNRLTLLILTLITICAYFIRVKFSFDSPYATHFSTDDFGHCSRAGLLADGASSFTQIINASYSDAHPIFRNLVLNIIFRLSNNVYDARLVSMIPGILLVPLSFFFTKIVYLHMNGKSKYSNLIALTISCFYAFSFICINLSIGTRPYNLMLIFQICSLISLLSFSKFKNIYLLIAFYFFCTLAIITDYSALMSIGTLAFASIILSWIKNLSFKYKNIVTIGSLILLFITGFQFYGMYKSVPSGTTTNRLEINTNLSYLNYIRSFKDFKDSLRETFRSFFIKLKDNRFQRNDPKEKKISIAMEFLYLIGLIYLIFIRSYLLLFIALCPMIFGVALSYLNLFPFNGYRHGVYLFLSILISYISVFSFLLNQRSWLITKFLFTLILIGFFNCSGIYKSSSEYLKLVSSTLNRFDPIPLSESTLMDIVDLINNNKYKEYDIILPEHLESRLRYYLITTKFKKSKTQPDLFKSLTEKEKNFLTNEYSVLYHFENHHIEYAGTKSLSGESFNKALVISLDPLRQESILKYLKDKGFTKSIIKVTHSDWIYDELQTD